MKKRTLAQVGLFFSIVVGIGFCLLLAFGRLEISLSEAELRQRIAAKLPMTAKDVTVTEVDLAIGKSDIAVAFKMNGVRLRQKFTMAAATTGVPVYRNGEFYFVASEVNIVEFKLGDGKIDERIKGFAERYIDGERKRKALIEAAPKIAEWMKGYAEQGAIHALERMPVYRVKNDVKGVLLKSSLESLRVENGNVVATISVIQLTWSVMIVLIAIMLSVGFLIALVRNPGWGLMLLLPFP